MSTRSMALGFLVLTTLACDGADPAGTTGSGGFGGTGGGSGGTGGGSEAPDCSLDEPGPSFDLVIRNVGARHLVVPLVCGGTLPLRVELEGELRQTSPGFCSFDCRLIYEQQSSTCSDCGPGRGTLLPPGGEVTLTWDRRVFESHVALPECTGREVQDQCVLGTLVPTNFVANAQVELCANEDASPEITYGTCESASLFGASPETVTIPFEIDVGTSSIVIEAQ